MKYDQKILIIRFSSIGDIILATSPLRTIRNAYPNAQITFLTLDLFAPLLEFHPCIDALLTVSKQSTFKKLMQFRKYLNSKNYNIVFDLHNSIRSRIISFTISPNIFRLKKPRIARFLLFNFFINIFNKDFSTLQMYHNCVSLNLTTMQKLPKTSIQLIKSEILLMKRFLKENFVKSEFIVIIPGAAWKQKQWKLDYYIQVIKKIKVDVILIGSKKDSICFELKSRLMDKVHNFAGKTSLREAFSILHLAKYVIGSDTGMTHAAEALGKPVTMILGPTSRETGAGTNLNESISVEKKIWCRPCSQNGSAECYRKKQYCIDLITPEDILSTIPKM